MATNGDDFIVFQGTLGQLTATLVNAYSGRSIFIDEEKNINTGSYDGLGGFDRIFMTSFGDYLAVENAVGVQLLANVEQIVAGNGGDIINLSSANIVLNDVIVEGGYGDDIIWGNAGDDEISGSNGVDIIDGGPGNDTLYGENDADDISGGDGNDFLYGGNHDDTLNGDAGSDLLDGGNGNDTLVYSADEVWPKGFVAWNVGAPDAIINGDRIVVNPRYRSHDGFDGGAGRDTIQMGDDAEALFLDDRYSDNPFGYNTARIVDVEVIRAGGGNDIIDLTSKQFSYGDVELYGEGGNDVLWGNAGNDYIDGGIGNDHLDGASGHDTLVGGAGNDKMYGWSGEDTFIIGEGADRVYTGVGSDTVRYDVMDALVDTLHDFTTGVGGDVLDIRDILQGYNELTDAISDFVELVQNGGDTEVHVNADGDAGGVFTAIAVFDGGIGDTLTDLINNGNLLA